MKGIKNWAKVTVLRFEGKFILCLKCSEWVKCQNQGSIVT